MTLARPQSHLFSDFSLASKHIEVNNRWSITWSYTGQQRLRKPHEFEEAINWQGLWMGNYSERWRKKNSGLICLLCDVLRFCGRQRWADNKSSWLGRFLGFSLAAGCKIRAER